MKDEQRITVLEDELKILKNEVKAVLLDLREQYLNIQNPFNQMMIPSADGPNPNMHLGQKEEPANTSAPEEVVPDQSEVETIDLNDQAPDQTQEIELPRNQRDSSNSAKLQTESIKSQSMEFPDGDKFARYSRIDSINPQLRSEASETEEFQDATAGPASSSYEVRKGQAGSCNGRQVDLVVIAGLTQWLDQAIIKLGKERTEVLIEISFTMGRLPQNLKEALIRMAHLSRREDSSAQSISASDYLSILAQLDNLLSGSKQQDNALLSILSMMKDSQNG